EVEAAIGGLGRNKSPGSDGITADFYISFRDLLAPVLLSLYQSMEEQRLTPGTLMLGLVSLVYKQRGDRSCLKNYRPISLLNTDYKILAKILANRLKNVIT
uniref:Reverse transcriptase domain-containing protein n=1 Tax=Acanthochromis polyacanthus TaxID=80966 RepID=A0A3Q1FHB9_9TELE